MKEFIFQGKKKQLIFIVTCKTVVEILCQIGNIIKTFNVRVRKAMYHQIF